LGVLCGIYHLTWGCVTGNSGGPAFADLQQAKVAGVAFSKLSNADNVGYIIPYQIIKHFLQVSLFAVTMSQ